MTGSASIELPDEIPPACEGGDEVLASSGQPEAGGSQEVPPMMGAEAAVVTRTDQNGDFRERSNSWVGFEEVGG